jgi:hypothetical protein
VRERIGVRVYRVKLGNLEDPSMVDNIKMYLQEVGLGMDWIDLAQDRDRWLALVSAVMNLRVQSNTGNFLTS